MTTPLERIQIEAIKTELKERFKSIDKIDFISICDSYHHCMYIAIYEMHKALMEEK